MKKTQENAIMNQYENSSEHQANITRGLTIDHHTEIGEGNLTQSVIEYDNGEVWIFGLNGEPGFNPLPALSRGEMPDARL